LRRNNLILNDLRSRGGEFSQSVHCAIGDILTHYFGRWHTFTGTRFGIALNSKWLEWRPAWVEPRRSARPADTTSGLPHLAVSRRVRTRPGFGCRSMAPMRARSKEGSHTARYDSSAQRCLPRGSGTATGRAITPKAACPDSKSGFPPRSKVDRRKSACLGFGCRLGCIREAEPGFVRP